MATVPASGCQSRSDRTTEEPPRRADVGGFVMYDARMTVIRLDALATALGDPFEAPINGKVTALAWRGRAPVVRLDGPTVTFPDDLVVRIEDGTPARELDLEPTTGDWCWRLDLDSFDPSHQVVRYVVVPASGPVDWADLVDIDPESYTPEAEPELGWWVELEKRPILVRLTQAEYDALTPVEQADPLKLYVIPAI